MKKEIIKAIPMTILVIVIAITFYDMAYKNYILFDKSYYGIFGVFLSLLFFLMSRKDISFYVTGIILFLGSINIVAFTTEIVRKDFGFSIGKINVEFSFQPFSVLIYLIWAIIFLVFELKNLTKG